MKLKTKQQQKKNTYIGFGGLRDKIFVIEPED